ncbi:protein MIX23 [Harmonia axyridis]|uniref:protein MIX23 n=1 Tax=Harmonia axyridis TaxID=115357 RepID=UPI001E274ED4|nr:protein MIX23 [Harmonia axyridis]XP_045461442.1 protein MIX23 [Harmonia axyridis]
MPEAVMECGDFSEFQEAIKNMRKFDDIIVNTLNSVIPTDSFHPNGEKSCKELYAQLQEGSIKRESTIKNCITITADKVRKLKNQREHSDDISLSKTLRAEQTKLRMLQVELSVEDLVGQRTSKVFNDKCRKYWKPQ